VVEEIPLVGDVFRRGNNNEISDGGNDMYDGGNRLHTNLFPTNYIPYTHSQAELEFPKDGAIVSGDTYFGSGSQYFTNMYPGMFVLGVSGASVSSFSIEGNNGADTSGSVESGQFASSGWTCFYKTVWDGYTPGDPTINHLILTLGDGTGITHECASSTDDDHDVISGTIPARFYYVLVSNRNGSRLTESDLQTIAAAFLTKVGNPLSVTLSNLNAGFEDITATVPDLFTFSDDGVGEIGLSYPQAAVCLTENEFFVTGGEDGNLYKVTITGGEGVVEIWQPLENYLEAMARLDDKIYGIIGPFLVIMDLDGNVLNEGEDEKYSIVTSEFLENLFTKDGVLYGSRDENVFTVNVETGECILHKSGLYPDYRDMAGV
jgi:hypothetical protein